jgi:hypothetical protein
MSKSSSKTPIQMPSVAEDRKITAAAKADPDAQPLTKAQLEQMLPAKALRGLAKRYVETQSRRRLRGGA